MNNSTIAPRYEIETDPDRINLHTGRGNGKLDRSILHYSTAPGAGVTTFKSGQPVTGCAGTCAGVCHACFDREKPWKSPCYATQNFIQYVDTARAWSENTLLIRERPQRFRLQLLEAMQSTKTSEFTRYHVGGEFMPGAYGMQELNALVEAARTFPDRVVYGYSKRSLLFAQYRDQYGKLPDNLVNTCSLWKQTVTNYTGAQAFVYDDHTDPAIMALPHCPAVDETGHKTGIKCGAGCVWCMENRPGELMAIHAHGTKADR